MATFIGQYSTRLSPNYFMNQNRFNAIPISEWFFYRHWQVDFKIWKGEGHRVVEIFFLKDGQRWKTHTV